MSIIVGAYQNKLYSYITLPNFLVLRFCIPCPVILLTLKNWLLCFISLLYLYCHFLSTTSENDLTYVSKVLNIMIKYNLVKLYLMCSINCILNVSWISSNYEGVLHIFTFSLKHAYFLLGIKHLNE